MKTKRKRMTAWMLCLCLLMGMSGCAAAEETVGMVAVEYKEADMDASWDAAEAIPITFDGDQADIQGGGAVLGDGVLTISEGGDYLLSGSFDGRIVVNADKKDDVRLILNGLSVTSGDSAVLFILKADKATITMAEGTENILVSGENLIYEEDEELDAAIYSKADLVVNGKGSLNVDSSAGHGILSKDDLRITGGTITVDAAKDGLRGRDAVQMNAGVVSVVAGEDGVKSNNDEDAERGYVSIDGGELNIAAGEDGIQAETVLQIRGGSVNITAGGGAGEAQQAESGMDFKGGWRRTDSASSEDEVSMKGLKAGSALFAAGGEIQVDSKDDALHSDGDMSVSGGTIALKSGDDGVHAEGTLTISDGSLTVSQSYEGLEALYLIIEGGETRVTASDDGLNAAGGSDDDSDWNWNSNPFAAGDYMIRITGGMLYVNAGGDGLDSNGALYFEGGEVYVSGPTNSGNGAIDGAGEMTVSGGILLAAGSSGMASAPSANGQAVTMVYTDTQPGGQKVTVRNAKGETLAEFTPEKEWSSIVISVPGLAEGEELSLYAGDALLTTATVGEGAGMGGMGGGMNGGKSGKGGKGW